MSAGRIMGEDEYALYAKYSTKFMNLFGVPLASFWTSKVENGPEPGFNGVGFAVWLKPWLTETAFDSVLRRFGENGLRMVGELLEIDSDEIEELISNPQSKVLTDEPEAQDIERRWRACNETG